MIVVIAGIYRSGSTAQYNMVRLILESVYGKKAVNCVGNPNKVKKGINIVKLHPFNKSLFNKADFIFTTDRPDKEIKKSMIAFSNKSECSDDFLKKIKKDLALWRRRSVHQDYNLIKNKPNKCIDQIIKTLKLKVDPNKIYHEFANIRPPSQKDHYDPRTFLFHKHITNYDQEK